MPNQRAKTKLYLGGFVEKELYATLSRMAEEAGMGDNRFGYVTGLLKEALAKRRRAHASKSRKRVAPRGRRKSRA